MEVENFCVPEVLKRKGKEKIILKKMKKTTRFIFQIFYKEKLSDTKPLESQKYGENLQGIKRNEKMLYYRRKLTN